MCVCVCNQASWPAARERRKQSAFFRHEWGPDGEGFLCGAIKTTRQWRMPTAPTFQTFLPGTRARAQRNSPLTLNGPQISSRVYFMLNYRYVSLVKGQNVWKFSTKWSVQENTVADIQLTTIYDLFFGVFFRNIYNK